VGAPGEGERGGCPGRACPRSPARTRPRPLRVRAAVQETEAIQEDELAQLPPGAFETDIALKHPDNPAWNLKYLWDFFPPSYNCPLREKVRASAAGARLHRLTVR